MSSRIWELSFILFFVSLHRVTQILNLITYFRGAVTETVIRRSLLPKVNGGGDRGVHVHSQRAMQSILCSVKDDTMTLVLQLFASHAGRQELSA